MTKSAIQLNLEQQVKPSMCNNNNIIIIVIGNMTSLSAEMTSSQCSCYEQPPPVCVCV